MENILEHQTVVFIYSLLWGGVLGVLYDVFRVYRICVRSSTVSVIIQDVIFFSVCTVIVFLFLLSNVNGQLRGYYILGMFLGAVIYHYSLGNIVVRILASFVKITQAIIIRPLIKLILAIKKLLNKILGAILFKLKKVGSFFQIRLKKYTGLLYNHTRSVFISRTEKSDAENNQKRRQNFFERCRKKTCKKKCSKKEKKFLV